jgi:hypothetical protein
MPPVSKSSGALIARRTKKRLRNRAGFDPDGLLTIRSNATNSSLSCIVARYRLCLLSIHRWLGVLPVGHTFG